MTAISIISPLVVHIKIPPPSCEQLYVDISTYGCPEVEGTVGAKGGGWVGVGGARGRSVGIVTGPEELPPGNIEKFGTCVFVIGCAQLSKDEPNMLPNGFGPVTVSGSAAVARISRMPMATINSSNVMPREECAVLWTRSISRLLV